MDRTTWRRMIDRFMRSLITVLTVLVVVPLFSLLLYVTLKGIGTVNLDFFTQLPGSVGSERVGLGNAIVGSGIMLLVASLLGIPTGLFTGIYLSEYGRNRYASLVRFLTEVFSGIPSIIMGVFVYTLIVIRMGHFSGLAGGVALGIMMIPWITISTYEILQTIPDTIRHGGLALGVPYWKMVLHLVLPAATGGLLTGILLGIARVAGETAPLLFTALNSRYWPRSLFEPIASLPIYIYTYAIQPFKERQDLAWGGAFILLVLIMLLNLGSRWVAGRSQSPRRR